MPTRVSIIGSAYGLSVAVIAALEENGITIVDIESHIITNNFEKEIDEMTYPIHLTSDYIDFNLPTQGKQKAQWKNEIKGRPRK